VDKSCHDSCNCFPTFNCIAKSYVNALYFPDSTCVPRIPFYHIDCWQARGINLFSGGDATSLLGEGAGLSVADALNINWNLVYIRQTRTRGHQWGFPFSQFPSSCFEHLWRLMSIPRTWPWQDDCLDKVLFFFPFSTLKQHLAIALASGKWSAAPMGGYSDKFASWFSSSRLINLSCIFSDRL
jgi:hypothetical protein